MGKSLRRWLPGILSIAASLTLAGFVFARAGGGEGYSGGGGDGGGGGGNGGSGIGWLIYFWIRFCIAEPLIGLPVTVGVLVVIYFAHQNGMAAYQGSVLRRGGVAIDNNQTAQASNALADSDPGFNESAFYQRIRDAFLKIQTAWCGQDLSNVRPFISDGIHERFSIQFDEQKAIGYRDQMSGIQIESVRLAEVASDHVFDIATVRIAASAVDVRLSTIDGRKISGTGVSEPFVEFWSFLRRRGAKSDPSKPGLIEGNCPNCGAAILMNQSAKCDHCGALLRSGQYDWVLAEISQESEWRPNRRNRLPGEADLRKIDPGFNRVDLEDRVSVMFWRKTMSDRVGKIDALRKIAAEDFCHAYASTLAAAPDGTRTFYCDCAVGTVQALGVLTDETMQHGVVEVWWEGAKTISKPGCAPTITHERIQAHHLFLLSRKPGVTSDPGQSVSSAHCPNCGAATPADVSSACPFCGTVFNDGSRGWILSKIATSASSEGQAIMGQLRGQTPATTVAGAGWIAHVPPSGLLCWAIKTALADGQIDLNEKRMLASLADKAGVTPERLNEMISTAQRGMLEIPDPPDEQTARAWLTTIVDMALADGTIEPAEIDLLSAVARKYGFSQSDMALLVRERKAERLSLSRDALRSAKAAGSIQ